MAESPNPELQNLPDKQVVADEKRERKKKRII